MKTRFLFKQALWDEFKARLPAKTPVRAAVAYLGSGGAALLPLREGDQLVVDMSLGAVRAGVTDPREVKKLLDRGVIVFSRASLHAKFFVIDDVTIAGSSNISKRAKDYLDEAAIVTDDPSTRRRALSTFGQLCDEPVRDAYLNRCIAEYRPPKFVPGGSARKPAAAAKRAWIIGGLHYQDWPASEVEAIEAATSRAEKKLRDYERCEVASCRYTARPKYFERMREGDWLIVCVADARGFEVTPPSKFFGIERYKRAGGRYGYMLTYELPTGAPMIRWTSLRSGPRELVPVLGARKPRTTLISDPDSAHALMALWDARGHFQSTRPNR